MRVLLNILLTGLFGALLAAGGALAQPINFKSLPEQQVAELLSLPTAFPDDYYYSIDWTSFEPWYEVNQPIDYRNVDYGLLNAVVFYYTNKYRKENGRTELRFSPELRDAAVAHSLQMVKYNFFDHTNRNNRKLYTAVERSRYFGYEGPFVGENLAEQYLLRYEPRRKFWYTYAGDDVVYHYGDSVHRERDIEAHSYLSFGKAIVDAWINSKGHRKNLISMDYQSLGCGVAVNFRSLDRFHIPQAVGTQNFGN